MPEPVTKAAGGPPPEARVLQRTGLFDHLDATLGGRLTLISAGPGTGKTALLRSWLRARGHPSAWLSVERGERDPQHFWAALVAAIAAGAGGDRALEAPSPSPNFDGRAAVEGLVTGLDELEQPLVLVVDDLHELSSGVAEEQLEMLLEKMPSRHHVVLSTRRDPDLGLHRLRLSGDLQEIRSDDLRFSREEARELLRDAGVDLSPDGSEALYERTEGWAVGLRLAALSLAGIDDPERFVSDFSGTHRTVADYLLSEVLGRQTEETRRLLLRTSILDRLNGSVAEAVSGVAGAEAKLAELTESGAFVVSLDSRRQSFRYHRLFADLLKAQLMRVEPEAVPGLHAAAARWYADNGGAVDAITHAQKAGDESLAISLLAENYFSLILDGRRATATILLESFPRDTDQHRPELAMVVAADQLDNGSLEQAAAHLDLARRQADDVPAERRNRFRAGVALLDLTLARKRGDFAGVLERFTGLDVSWEADNTLEIAVQNDLRAAALMNLGIVEAWAGRSEDGARHLEEARGFARSIGRPYLEVGSLAHLASTAGRHSFARAEEACREALEIAADHGWDQDPVIVVPTLASLAAACAQTGRFEEAETYLERAEALLHAEVEPAVAFYQHLVHGGIEQARGRLAEAARSYERAAVVEARMASPPRLSLQMRCAALQVALILEGPAAVRSGLRAMSEEERLSGEAQEVLARVALAENDPEAALGILDPIVDGEASSHHPAVVIRSLLLAASAHEELGEAHAGEAALERALDLAEPDRLIFPFAHMMSTDALEHHPRHRTAHRAFILEILDAIAGNPRVHAQGGAVDGRVPESSQVDLSPAELRVLRYLPSNMPAPEIAGELYLSLNTVKTHMRHLYAKLDAHSRAEAVARARVLGLLSPSASRR